jgi:hypothetical protein
MGDMDSEGKQPFSITMSQAKFQVTSVEKFPGDQIFQGNNAQQFLGTVIRQLQLMLIKTVPERLGN